MSLILQIIYVAIAGIAGGFIGGQVGAGAIIAIPALLLTGLSPAQAVATNAIAGLLGNGVAAAKYWHHQKFDIKHLLPATLLALIGAVIGAHMLIFINQDILKKIFSIFFMAIAFIVFKKTRVVKKKLPMSLTMNILGLFVAFLIGVYGGLLAVGVTTLFIYSFTEFFQTTLLEAVTYSMFIVTIVFGAILVVYASYHAMNYPLAISLGIGTAIGSYIGAHVAIHKGEVWLKKLLIAVALLTSLKLIIGM